MQRLVIDMLPRRDSCVSRAVSTHWRAMVDACHNSVRESATRMDEHLAAKGMVWPAVIAGSAPYLRVLRLLITALPDEALP